jgi:starch synthase
VKAGGMADANALLFDGLCESGATVHLALPDFRTILGPESAACSRRLHLCKDREFSYRRSVYEGDADSNLRAALAFQRDVIHYVLPQLRPDLVHCHDWMTGLIPAAARKMGIPSVFTLHNLHDECASLEHIEDRGIDAAGFWKHLYFRNYPGCYETARHEHNAVSMLASGILAADEMNTVSESFLAELVSGRHGAPGCVADAAWRKLDAGCAHGIPNSLPASCSPERDTSLPQSYDASSHVAGKRANKRKLQQMLGLELDEDAPMLFWPSRLDPMQKGCQLLAEILYQVVSDYWALGLQVVFVADGPFRMYFEGIARHHQLEHRIAVRGFERNLSRLGYASADYILMPSAYEPCGLAQMVGLRYGSLPIVHATGGLRDTVKPLAPDGASGNGFVFEFHDTQGLRWAIDEAMRFRIRPAAEREAVVARIMTEAAESFTPAGMIDRYLALYRKLLNGNEHPTPTHTYG